MSIRIPWSEELHPAVGIYRRPGGWEAFISRRAAARRKFFGDTALGGPESSLAAALRWRKRLERELGGVSKGWWLGPDRAGSITLVRDRHGNESWMVSLCFRGQILRRSFSVNRHGKAAGRELAEQTLGRWRRQLRRVCSEIAREEGRKAA